MNPQYRSEFFFSGTHGVFFSPSMAKNFFRMQPYAKDSVYSIESLRNCFSEGVLLDSYGVEYDVYRRESVAEGRVLNAGDFIETWGQVYQIREDVTVDDFHARTWSLKSGAETLLFAGSISKIVSGEIRITRR